MSPIFISSCEVTVLMGGVAGWLSGAWKVGMGVSLFVWRFNPMKTHAVQIRQLDLNHTAACANGSGVNLAVLGPQDPLAVKIRPLPILALQGGLATCPSDAMLVPVAALPGWRSALRVSEFPQDPTPGQILVE